MFLKISRFLRRYYTERFATTIFSVIGVKFIHFRKAFDSVDHEVLLYKMQTCGFYGNASVTMAGQLPGKL